MDRVRRSVASIMAVSALWPRKRATAGGETEEAVMGYDAPALCMMCAIVETPSGKVRPHADGLAFPRDRV
jgi:hypothetical protein